MQNQRPLRSLVLASLLFGATPALAQDSDGDGAPDSADAFPCDPSLEAEAYFPAQGQFGTLMFEDEWPQAGDQDFNDLVLDWNYAVQYDNAGATRLTGTFDVIALGGQYQLGLGLGLPVPKSSLQSATLSIDGGTARAMSASSADTDIVLTIPDLRSTLGLGAGPLNVVEGGATAPRVRITITVSFTSGVALATGAAPFDVFAIRSGPEAQPGHEIHRPEYAGTANMNGALFNTGSDASGAQRKFVDGLGLPFAISVASRSEYPREETHLANVFPDVLSFASSGGATNANFHTTNVQAGFAFSSRAAGASPAPTVSDQSCRYITICEGGLAWTKIYQIANGQDRNTSAFALTTTEVGDIRSTQTGANAKLSDAEINSLATPLSGYARAYRMHSTDASQTLYVRTNQAYDDLQRSFGVIDSATRVGLGSTYGAVSTWAQLPAANHGIDLLYTSPNIGGESCNRYFLGHSRLDCWSGPDNVRCVNGGYNCSRYRKLQNVTLWIYTGGC